MTTQTHRLAGRPSACSVTPEEYMSMLLIANSCGSARIRNGQKNQLANDAGTPVTAVTFGLTR